jgi:hypothetical protein
MLSSVYFFYFFVSFSLFSLTISIVFEDSILFNENIAALYICQFFSLVSKIWIFLCVHFIFSHIVFLGFNSWLCVFNLMFLFIFSWLKIINYFYLYTYLAIWENFSHLSSSNFVPFLYFYFSETHKISVILDYLIHF